MPEKATLIAELRGVIADLRADRDAWREQTQRLALPAPKPVDARSENPSSNRRSDGGRGCARPAELLNGPVKWRVASRRPGPLRKQTPASSSATPTGRRLPMCISRRSRGGARRRRRCHRRVASARADHGKLIAAVRRPPLVINRSLARILIDTPVADKLLRHPVGAPFGSGRR